MDRNDVYLQGKIGEDFKYSTTKEGNEYATFSLIIEPPQIQTDRGRNTFTLVRIMVFKPALVERLHKVNAHTGNSVNILAYLNSRKTEVGGRTLILNTVIVRDITIAKTQ